MFFYLLILFIFVPIIEIRLIIALANQIQWPATIAIMLLTGVLGAWLARREGFRAFAKIQNEMNQGIPPATSMVDGLLILIAGIVLITPGLLTDAIGFSLLIPPVRTAFRKKLTSWFTTRVQVIHFDGQQAHHSSHDESIIDTHSTGFYTDTSGQAEYKQDESLPSNSGG